MRFVGWPGLASTAVVLASGCAGGGAGGAGGSSVAASSASSSSATTTTTGAGGSGTGAGTGTGGSGFQPSGFSCSGNMPSLANDVVPITSANCATSVSCHLAMQSSSGLYAQLVNEIAEECTDLRKDVKPGDPEHSYVIQKLTDKNVCSGVRMPNGGQMLPAGEIQTIYDWICEGAPQN